MFLTNSQAAAAYARGVHAFESGDFATAEQIFSALVRQEPRLHQVCVPCS